MHKKLAVYRLNHRREFFRLPPDVARSVVLAECRLVNEELGLDPPVTVEVENPPRLLSRENPTVSYEDELFKSLPVSSVPIANLRQSPINTTLLSEPQIERIRTLQMIFAAVYPETARDWLETFSRDTFLDREIRVWEHIALAYMQIAQVDLVSQEMKKEAFELLLARSLASTKEVLAEARLVHFSPQTANRLLKKYSLKPMPVIMRSGSRPRT